jgi:hypothetical protein
MGINLARVPGNEVHAGALREDWGNPMGFGMYAYVAVSFDDAGKPMHSRVGTRRNDEHAVDDAREWAEGAPVEVWQGRRLIARLNVGDVSNAA